MITDIYLLITLNGGSTLVNGHWNLKIVILQSFARLTIGFSKATSNTAGIFSLLSIGLYKDKLATISPISPLGLIKPFQKCKPLLKFLEIKKIVNKST
jgi:hypothetical protein